MQKKYTKKHQVSCDAKMQRIYEELVEEYAPALKKLADTPTTSPTSLHKKA